MPNALKVGVLVGSLRRGSYSRQIAKALIERSGGGLACEIIEIGQLPLYNQDLDDAPPQAWIDYRQALKACDALLFVTPEYNRSLPGCLKNATDIGSRPQGQNAFAGLPAAVVSVSPYGMGGFGANHALRQNFVYLDLAVMQQPEAYIANVAKSLDDQGRVTSTETDSFLKKFMQAFGDWATRVRRPGEDFAAFLARREEISNEYIRGHAGPLLEILADTDPATFLAPNGEQVVGAAPVREANLQGAKTFRDGSRGHFEVLQSGTSGTLGFWTGTQQATMAIDGKDEPVTMHLRTTEVFRYEGGGWKLVHRHADMKSSDK